MCREMLKPHFVLVNLQVRVQSRPETCEETGWSRTRFQGRDGDKEGEGDGNPLRFPTACSQMYPQLLLWLCDEEGVRSLSCSGLVSDHVTV